jgi:hypothetical protein
VNPLISEMFVCSSDSLLLFVVSLAAGLVARGQGSRGLGFHATAACGCASDAATAAAAAPATAAAATDLQRAGVQDTPVSAAARGPDEPGMHG